MLGLSVQIKIKDLLFSLSFSYETMDQNTGLGYLKMNTNTN